MIRALVSGLIAATLTYFTASPAPHPIMNAPAHVMQVTER